MIPEGPADGRLEPGDVLLALEGRPLREFVALEAALDDAVGRAVALRVERRGAPLDVSVPVEDLHAITPASYLEHGGAVLHALSFQQARNHAVPIAGIYVASPRLRVRARGDPRRRGR